MPDFGDFGVFEYPRPAAARALRERLRDIHRIGITVARDMDTADDIIHIDDVGECLDFFGGHNMNGEVKHLGHRGAAFQLLEPLRIGRHRNRAALAVSRRLARLSLKPAIQLAGIFGELGHVYAGA